MLVIYINPKKQIINAIKSGGNELFNLLPKEKRMIIASEMNKIDYKIRIDDKDIIMKDNVIK